jgi:HEAT repeat protein
MSQKKTGGRDNIVTAFLLVILSPMIVLSHSSGLVTPRMATSVDALIADLQNPDEGVRARAAERLGPVIDPKTVGPLVGALKDESLSVQIRAAYSLAVKCRRMGSVMETLVSLLSSHENQYVRAGAVTAISGCATPTQSTPVERRAQVVEALLDALEDEHPRVRASAVDVLGSLGPFPDNPKVVESLVALLSDDSSVVKGEAANALAKTKDPQALDALTILIRSPASSDNDKIEAARALGIWVSRNDGQGAVTALVETLRDDNQRVQYWVTSALGSCKESSLPVLKRALSDEDPRVRVGVADALARIVSRESTLEKLFLLALQARDLAVIAGARRFFIQRGDENTEDILCEAFVAHGTRRVAEDFLNSGNARLQEMAQAWNKEHGYHVMKVSGLGRGPAWGSKR